MSKRIKIGLLSHYFKDSNLGCTALSICNLILIDKAVSELGYEAKYVIFENEKQPQVSLDFIDVQYEYRVFPSTKQAIKHPVKLLNTHIFDDCDLVFNLCAGDGFTDIYGTWRTFSETYMTLLSIKKGCNTVLAPQTIGPFSNNISNYLAKKAMDGCEAIFARDHLSYELCKTMGQEQKTTEVVDVALALPYKRVNLQEGFNVGINVSGLLYDKEDRFGLHIDYDRFIHEIIEYCLNNKFNVHLISHVNIPNGFGEDDYAACKKINNKYSQTILAPKFDSPIDAKGYISGLDLFTGARMHATIGALSSNVPVIPIAYSRKVNGLYGNLQYPYFIDAKNESMSNEKAFLLFKNYVSRLNEIKDNLGKSKLIYDRELKKYIEAVKSLLILSV